MFLCSSERVILEIRCLLSGLFTRSDSVGHVLGAALAHLFFQAVPPLWALAWLWYESKSFWKKQAPSDLCSVCILQWLHRQLELEFCSVCVSFCWRECKCGFSRSEQRGPAGPLHPRVCAPCLLSLGGKSKMLRSVLHCALAWLGFQWLEMKGIFIFLSQQLNQFDCRKFAENLWLDLLLYSPAWFFLCSENERFVFNAPT